MFKGDVGVYFLSRAITVYYSMTQGAPILSSESQMHFAFPLPSISQKKPAASRKQGKFTYENFQYQFTKTIRHFDHLSESWSIMMEFRCCSCKVSGQIELISNTQTKFRLFSQHTCHPTLPKTPRDKIYRPCEVLTQTQYDEILSQFLKTPFNYANVIPLRENILHEIREQININTSFIFDSICTLRLKLAKAKQSSDQTMRNSQCL